MRKLILLCCSLFAASSVQAAIYLQPFVGVQDESCRDACDVSYSVDNGVVGAAAGAVFGDTVQVGGELSVSNLGAMAGAFAWYNTGGFSLGAGGGVLGEAPDVISRIGGQPVRSESSDGTFWAAEAGWKSVYIRYTRLRSEHKGNTMTPGVGVERTLELDRDIVTIGYRFRF